ncbi:hypothetical protein L596_017877 [Steinernema carpocapsae]|uniref:Uncharacterized protein n=1 Tax=Steinernema carpocapsae TaxID=34508 RepID=A0A4U5N378_STECR|nr:hypothetical protein L596_017877 [Steinernema carpocapsae]
MPIKETLSEALHDLPVRFMWLVCSYSSQDPEIVPEVVHELSRNEGQITNGLWTATPKEVEIKSVDPENIYLGEYGNVNIDSEVAQRMINQAKILKFSKLHLNDEKKPFFNAWRSESGATSHRSAHLQRANSLSTQRIYRRNRQEGDPIRQVPSPCQNPFFAKFLAS